MRNHLVIGVVVTFSFAVTWPSRALAQCPDNQCVVGALQGCAYQVSTAPTFSILNPSCLNGEGSVSYDLTTGNVMAQSHARSHEGFDSWVQTADDFVINGPASATPIPLSLFLTVDLNVGGYSTARLSSGALQVATDPAGPAHQILRLDLVKLPGEHFTVGMYADAASMPFLLITTTGTLGITAPPPGYALQSCQGYSALPVPARATSWARLKQFYR